MINHSGAKAEVDIANLTSEMLKQKIDENIRLESEILYVIKPKISPDDLIKIYQIAKKARETLIYKDKEKQTELRKKIKQSRKKRVPLSPEDTEQLIVLRYINAKIECIQREWQERNQQDIKVPLGSVRIRSIRQYSYTDCDTHLDLLYIMTTISKFINQDIKLISNHGFQSKFVNDKTKIDMTDINLNDIQTYYLKLSKNSKIKKLYNYLKSNLEHETLTYDKEAPYRFIMNGNVYKPIEDTSFNTRDIYNNGSFIARVVLFIGWYECEILRLSKSTQYYSLPYVRFEDLKVKNIHSIADLQKLDVLDQYVDYSLPYVRKVQNIESIEDLQKLQSKIALLNLFIDHRKTEDYLFTKLLQLDKEIGKTWGDIAKDISVSHNKITIEQNKWLDKRMEEDRIKEEEEHKTWRDITKAFFRRLFCCRAVEERRKRSYTTLLASRKKSLQEYFDNELLEIEKKGIETSHNIRRSVRKDMSIEYNARAKAFNLVVEKSIADEVEITAQSIKSTKEQPLLFTEFINAQSTQVDSIINI